MAAKNKDGKKLPEKEKHISRRNFINSGVKTCAILAMGTVAGKVLKNNSTKDSVWQLNPNKCVQCGRCATHCIKTPSAVKCVHVYDICGYCELCGGYFRPNAKNLNTGAENQLCPTGAIERVYIEEPYYEYHIKEELCIGCAKCVAGCGAFGNGSMHLQVVHDLCDNCNQCAIARSCPAEAFERVSSDQPYLLKGGVLPGKDEM